MLIQMRSKFAKLLTFILFGLLILSFAVWGIGDIFRTDTTVAAVATVGDTEIDQIDFSRALNREMNNLRRISRGQIDFAQAQALGIVDQVLQDLITRALFQEQASDMRLLVTDAQIKQRIRDEPSFQNHLGDFERGRFFQILRSNNMSEQEFVEVLARDVMRQQIIEAVVGASQAPQVVAEAIYAYQQEQRIAETIPVERADLGAVAAPSEEQLRSVYADRSNAFMAPEYRAVSLIHLNAEALAAGVTVTDEELQAEFDSRRDDFREPERRHVRQAVFASEADAQAAKTRLDAGESLDQVAEEMLGRAPVDLGPLARDELDGQLPEVAAAVFGLESTQTTTPVKSAFGWHIAQVESIEPAVEAEFGAVRDELREDLAMRQAVDQMIATANKLDDELGSGASLEEAAEILGLSVVTVAAMDRNGNDADGKTIELIPGTDDFRTTAFDTASGETSLLIEAEDGNYFVVRVDSLTPTTVRPFEDVREQVVALWNELELARLGRERAEALAERVRGGEDMAAVAEAEGLPHRLSDAMTRARGEVEGARSRALAAKAFELKVGEVAVIETTEGHQVVKLTQVLPADPASATDAVTQGKAQIARALRGDLLSGFIASLRATHSVDINERVVQNTTASF